GRREPWSCPVASRSKVGLFAAGVFRQGLGPCMGPVFRLLAWGRRCGTTRVETGPKRDLSESGESEARSQWGRPVWHIDRAEVTLTSPCVFGSFMQNVTRKHYRNRCLSA